MDASDDELLTRYLLGDLPEEEQERLQERYLADADLFDRLLVVEDELIDGYVGAILTPQQRGQFEDYYLCSAERRERVAFARALTTVAASRPATTDDRRPWWRSLATLLSPQVSPARFAMALGAVALVAGGGWLAAEAIRLREEVASARADRAAALDAERDLRRRVDEETERSAGLARELERERGERESIEQDLARERAARGADRPAELQWVLVTLAPGMVRGNAETQRVTIGPGVEQVRVRLRLDTDGAGERYRARLESADGAELWSAGGLAARGTGASRYVPVTIPSSRLVRGDYAIILEGVAPDGAILGAADYTFRVARD